jgi:putative flippase GtrA
MKALLVQAVRFAVVGLANTSIGLLTIYAIMFFTPAGPLVANACGYAVGLAISFALNRSWTFQDRGNGKRALMRFLVCAAACFAANLGVVWFATERAAINPYWAQLVGVAIYTATMFVLCRWYVFARPAVAPAP